MPVWSSPTGIIGRRSFPTYPGHFDGEMLHSHDVKSKEQVKGKRVLVVGAGNSAVDILSDAAIENGRVVHSMRRTYYFFPKTVFGKPTDVFIDYTSRIPLPRKLMRLLYRWGMRIVVGPHRRFGLERPDHDLFEAHPTACNTYIDHLIHGRTIVKPGIERLDGKRVIFTDGSEEEVDFLIWATGYRPSFPFIDTSYILDEQGKSKLFIHTFSRELDDLFVVGLFEPAEGGVWQIADYQARLIAAFIKAEETDPKRAAWFRALKARANPDIGHGIRWKDTPWHRFEIQHYRFRRYMKRLLRKFGLPSGEKVEPHLMPFEGAARAPTPSSSSRLRRWRLRTGCGRPLARNDLLQQPGSDRDFAGEGPVVALDQQDRRRNAGREQCQGYGASGAVIAVDEGNGDQCAKRLKQQPGPLDDAHRRLADDDALTPRVQGCLDRSHDLVLRQFLSWVFRRQRERGVERFDQFRRHRSERGALARHIGPLLIDGRLDVLVDQSA